MKNKWYAVIMLLILAVLLCFISYRINKNNNKSNQPKLTSTPDNDDTGINDISPIATIPGFTIDDYELKIYTIDSKSNNVIPVTALVYGEEITPELIVDYVIESMEDAYYFIEVLEVITENDTVIVDFSADTPPCLSVSEKIENAILDSFAQSIVDNLENCKRIIFRTNGEYYKSDNKSYSKDYVHIDNK